MRRVPQPVAIVTASNTEMGQDQDREAWRGATISSFNTVTLDPEPIVSFNIKRLSSTFDAIESSDRFWVHFLTLEHSAVQLAERFTQGNNKALFGGVNTWGKAPHEGRPTSFEVPKIKSLNGSREKGSGQQIAFVLDCVYLKYKTVSIGDHVVLFGTVTDISSTDFSSQGIAPGSTSCLVYADRTYHGLRNL